MRKTPAGLYALEPHFVAPLLDVAASDYLVFIVRRLVELLSAKSSTLAGTRRQRNQSLADFSSSDIANFWLLYSVNTWLPVFRHLYESQGRHPEALFSAMSGLGGQHSRRSPARSSRATCLGTITKTSGPVSPIWTRNSGPPETVVPSHFVALPLKLVQPNIYAALLDREDYLKNTRMYLAVSADIGQAELISRTPHLVKLCSADLIDHLVQRALPGVPLTHVPSPPSAIPVKLNYQYFSLRPLWAAPGRPSSGPWEMSPPDVPGEFLEPQLELIILLPQAAA